MNHETIAFLCGIVFAIATAMLADYRYRSLLVAKAKAHEVEFIHGEPIVLMPEKDYIEIALSEKRQ
jgi:hypothetical protein